MPKANSIFWYIMAHDTPALFAHDNDHDDVRDTSEALDLSDISDPITVVDVQAEPQHVLVRASLKEEISTLTGPYQVSGKRPPFSTAEMVVMAIICGNEASYTIASSRRSIITTYPYYRDKVLKELLVNWECEFSDFRPVELVPELVDTFHRHDVPLVRYEDPSERDVQYLDDAEFTVTPQAARIFLESRLCDSRQGVFPFFKLPAELRNSIYEMVLRFHPSGIVINSNTCSAELRQHPEDEDSYVEEEGVVPRDCDIGNTNVIALLQVCKQAYAEAAPILYGQNKFTFAHEGLLCLNDMISARQSPATQHLEYVELFLRPFKVEARVFERAAQMLASGKRLKFLALDMRDRDWLEMSKVRRLDHYGRKSKFTKAGQIPGFRHLVEAAANAETFELKGGDESTRLKALFDAEIEKIEAGRGQKAPKKRAKKLKGKATSKSAVTVVDD
ncbi:hypothetical protein M409DRAFT_29446 [Zasmidium cellare ATCC 36951]|uniref:Fork-head domain-containing protein n=1 Tax=Zasmidium cellare ATCC 36951 TaxID=1080233 RepID=A0A6A6BZE1_ZASCE|nr:uncharacterized protein M409DRAFT_29446 [Zasmidium cellare ATCC 36951]KAF2160151.1 hypothetical protein M409DRAFT_29446 [Zasmidium cellare ATCC 36951]